MSEIKAPMGGKVIKILVNPGDAVAEDDEVLVLEAMKMEMPIASEITGSVDEIKVKVGDTVEADQILLTLK